MIKRGVECSIWIAAPRERVWRAVTEPAQLDLWYANCCGWEIPALRTGATVTFYNADTGANEDSLRATIEVLNPPRQFTLRWEPDATYPTMTLITTFLLEEQHGGTRVTIHETGYEALPDDLRRQWLDQMREGYTMSVENLQALLEGRSIPY
jgi:uncharacterized protein YndB with AHSA1/START domain